MLHIIEPYDNEKNLGRAYNEAMKYYNADDWVCLKDHDTLFLLPDTIRHISRYTELFPNAGILTCYTNRLANREQLLSVSYTHLRAHETGRNLVCRLLLE